MLLWSAKLLTAVAAEGPENRSAGQTGASSWSVRTADAD